MNENWDQVPVSEETAVYDQLPFTGWFLMLAWAAGPGRTIRRPGSLTESAKARVELDDEDEGWIRESVDDYLGRIGIPPVPPGHVWFLEMPEGAVSVHEVAARVEERLSAGREYSNSLPDGERLARQFQVMKAVLEGLYQ